MKFSYNWLKELVPSLPPPKKTATLLMLHAFEVVSLQRSEGDWVLDLDVLPNRMGDASSHQGMARELAAILSVKHASRKPVAVRIKETKLVEDEKNDTKDLLDVRIVDRGGCSFYAGRVIKGVRVKPSPRWLRERLRVLGLESINNIVDATNYVMLETGQPLHAFDFAKIARVPNAKGKMKKEKQIVVRKARNGERIKTLDGETHILESSVTVIADAKQALAIAGIKGGQRAAITDKTKTVVLEAALFSSERIYRTSRTLGIQSDSSRRFEAGRTASQTLRAMDRVAALIVSLAGGTVPRGVVVVEHKQATKRAVPFRPDRIEELLGVAVPAEDAKRALEALGCVVRAPKKSRSWVVNPPEERLDLEIQEDLVEEVGRLVGYRASRGAFQQAPLSTSAVPDEHRWADRARDILAGFGLTETMRYAFVNEELLERWGFGSLKVVELENPQSSDLTDLRPTLLPRLLLQAEEARRKSTDTGLFEIGRIFVPHARGAVGEWRALGIVVAREKPRRPSGFLVDHSVFYELKGIVQDLCERFGLTDVSWKPIGGDVEGPWHPGKTAELVVDGKAIGIVGELTPRMLKAHRRLGAVAAAEINFHALAEAASEEHEYRAPSKYPEVLRDVAVLVPQKVLVDDVGQVIALVGKKMVRDVDLFDYYEGENIPDGMKNLAFHIAYQSDEKTLTGEEVDALHKKITAALGRRGWEIR